MKNIFESRFGFFDKKGYLCTRFIRRRLLSSFKMETLLPFSIPVKGLRTGVHHYEFQIGRAFFAAFEASPIEEGELAVNLQFDKRPGLYILQFDIRGTVKTECDRCLASINLPIVDSQQLLVKFSEEDEQEEADVIYIHAEATQLNVAQYIYEFIILAVPMIKVYDCESKEESPCDLEMLAYLEGENEDQEASNPVWDALKNFKKDE